MHNIVRTLKSYRHSADLQAAANMQQVMDKLPPKIAERWSRQKRELQPKRVHLNDLNMWLETEAQVKKKRVYGSVTTPEKKNV